MPVPTHQDDCKTAIWRTECPDCGDIVYFFSCTCGSRVFFDLNRWPWNPHEDRCIPYLVRYLREVKGFSSTHIRQLIEQYAASRNVPIPEEIHQQIIAQENRDMGRVTIINVLPDEEEKFIVGQIISVNKVSFFKRLNYTDNAMGRALLGKLINQSHVEIVIREDLNKETRLCYQFKFFMPLISFNQSQVIQNSRAAITLMSHTMSDGQQIWLADEIHRAQ